MKQKTKTKKKKNKINKKKLLIVLKEWKNDYKQILKENNI